LLFIFHIREIAPFLLIVDVSQKYKVFPSPLPVAPHNSHSAHDAEQVINSTTKSSRFIVIFPAREQHQSNYSTNAAIKKLPHFSQQFAHQNSDFNI